MKTLEEIIKDFGEKPVAIGHFNISDLLTLRAVFAAARELSVPVMIGVSEGEREFIGVRQAAALVRSLRDEYDYPMFLNADHTHSLAKAKEAAEVGFDEILFDGSKLNFEENIKQTREAVKLVRAINPEILVEGEIGYIGSSSEILDKIPEGASLSPRSLTTPEEAARFVRKTGVDILAPAVGNMHGLLTSMAEGNERKRLDIKRIADIKKAVQIPLTLHGGSGTADEDFIAAIKAGINIVHINTEIRLAWRNGVEEGLKKNPREVAPYKILPPAFDAIKKLVTARIALFNE